MGSISEATSREFGRNQVALGRIGPGATSVGRWWSTDNSIEVAAFGPDRRKNTSASSDRWSRSVGPRELARLREPVTTMPNADPKVTPILMGREVVRGVEQSEALCFAAADFFA